MLRYETFCYLQNHKTACTFVETFLRQFSKEPLVRYIKHRAPNKRQKNVFYFVNVRDPLDSISRCSTTGSTNAAPFNGC